MSDTYDNNHQSDPANAPETTPEKDRPVTVRDGNIKASIWRNEHEKGVMHTTELSRSYQDKDGHWHDTNRFAGTDLLRVAEVARRAYEQSSTMDREARRATFRESRENRPASTQNRDRNR